MTVLGSPQTIAANLNHISVMPSGENQNQEVPNYLLISKYVNSDSTVHYMIKKNYEIPINLEGITEIGD